LTGKDAAGQRPFLRRGGGDHAADREHARRDRPKSAVPASAQTLEDLDVQSQEPHVDLLALESARCAGGRRSQLTLLVKLRYFVGLSIEETAESPDIRRRSSAVDYARPGSASR
jgi:hypothetical protein